MRTIFLYVDKHTHFLAGTSCTDLTMVLWLPPQEDAAGGRAAVDAAPPGPGRAAGHPPGHRGYAKLADGELGSGGP